MANDPREHTLHPRDAARVEAARAEAARDDARADAARAEAARAQAARAEAARDQLHVRPAPEYRPRRRRWPGVLAAAVIGAVIAGVMVSNYYSERTVGERLDSVVDKAGEKVQQGAQDVRSGLTQNVDDSRITTAVKTSLAADPALSALRINVTTRDGVVTLEGPAPDEKARERAAVLAAAPTGVVSVENRLVVKAN